MKQILIKLASLVVASLLCFSAVANDQRIVGGAPANSGAWPSTVALLNVDSVTRAEAGTFAYPNGNIVPFAQANYVAQECGASLITPTWVLTAAHCVVSSSGDTTEPSAIYALVGTSDLLSGGERKTVKRIIVHPDYVHTSEDADIALIELETATTVQPISVSGTDAATGTLAFVVGWGDLAENSATYPTVLHEVEVPIVSRATCEAVYGADLTQNMFCAGVMEGGSDSCQGDSGGPIMISSNGTYTQVGIVSWGIGCARTGIYGVYTRLSQYSAWMSEYINPSTSGGGGSFSILLALPLFGLIRRKLKLQKDL